MADYKIYTTANDPARFYDHIPAGDLFEDSLITHTPAWIKVVTTDGNRLFIYGSGFTYDAQHRLTGGMIDSIEFHKPSGVLIEELSGISVSATDFIDAVRDAGDAPRLDLAALFLSGNDAIDLRSADSSGGTVYAMSGNDIIRGSAGSDDIRAGAGNDRLIGNGGNDTLSGDAGNDRIHGNTGNDRLFGRAGNDFLEGDRGSDTLHGGTGSDTLAGGDSDDTVRGGAGNDILKGGNGSDRLVGGDGNDIIGDPSANYFTDVMLGGDGIDTAVYLGNSADYAGDYVNGFLTVTWENNGVADKLKGIERLGFDDGIFEFHDGVGWEKISNQPGYELLS